MQSRVVLRQGKYDFQYHSSFVLTSSRERLDEMAAAWEEWVADPDGMFCLCHGQVIARI